jgi:hypothetical protein
MKNKSKTLKKSARTAKHKPTKRRPFPYEKIAELWGQEKTIPEIAKAVSRVGKGDDPYHAMRVALTKMHKGYKNAKGEIVKLPHRITRTALRAATQAGKRAKTKRSPVRKSARPPNVTLRLKLPLSLDR